MCAPMRDFISKNHEVLSKKEVHIVYNHFNPWLPKGAIKEAEKWIEIKTIESHTTMLGHTFKK